MSHYHSSCKQPVSHVKKRQKLHLFQVLDTHGHLCPETLALNIIVQQGRIPVLDAFVTAATAH